MTDSLLATSKVKDALAYIRESAFYSDPKYAWMKDLIDKVITGSYYKRNLNVVIAGILPGYVAKKDDTQIENTDSENEETSSGLNESAFVLKKITSIKKVSNVGLVTAEEPIQLNDGLNVFFGPNASGKSSLYSAICKALGKANKKVFPNVHLQNDKSQCQLSCISQSGKEKDLQWVNDRENSEIAVMIFDSQISNYIIEDDQKNEFKIAYLKAHFFRFLQEMYIDMDNRLDEVNDDLETNMLSLEASLRAKIAGSFDQALLYSKDDLAKLMFTEAQDGTLNEAKQNLSGLKANAVDSIIKNVETEKSRIFDVLNGLAVLETDGVSKKQQWQCLFENEYLEKIKKHALDYLEKRGALSVDEMLNSQIKTEWINDDEWVDFIKKGVSFVQKLEESEKSKFSLEKCLYCQQPLQSKEAKNLMVAYKKMKDKLEADIASITDAIEKFSSCIAHAIKACDLLDMHKSAIISELENNKEYADFANTNQDVRSMFEKWIKDIKDYKGPVIDQGKYDSYKDIVSKGSDIYFQLVNKIKTLETNKRNADAKIKEYEDRIQGLQHIKHIVNNKTELLKYLGIEDNKSLIAEKKQSLSKLKKATSEQESLFAKEASLKIFHDHLIEEYKALGHTPSTKWSIKPITPKGVNKRVYNMGDRKLSEIFSEGEKKVHSLADFFTQGEINQFEGVYIFDDPVNSLDEDNIALVAKRIKKLADEGHQVIVFTHNIVFLNCLINTAKDKLTELRKFQQSVFIDRDVILGDRRGLGGRLKRLKDRAANIKKRAEKGERIDDLELGNAYDVMSGFIEEYVERVLLKDIICRYRPNIRMDGIDGLKTLDHAKLDEVSDLYKKTSRYGTRHSQPDPQPTPKPEVLLADIDDLINKLKI